MSMKLWRVNKIKYFIPIHVCRQLCCCILFREKLSLQKKPLYNLTNFKQLLIRLECEILAHVNSLSLVFLLAALVEHAAINTSLSHHWWKLIPFVFELFGVVCQVAILFSLNLTEICEYSAIQLSKPSKKQFDDRKVSMLFFKVVAGILFSRQEKPTGSCCVANITPHFLCVLPTISAAADSIAANKLPESSALVLLACKGFWRLTSVRDCCLTALFACAVTETDGWNSTERREAVVVVLLEEGGQQRKPGDDSEILKPPLVASLPVCLCGRQSADSLPPYQTPLLISAWFWLHSRLSPTQTCVSALHLAQCKSPYV